MAKNAVIVLAEANKPSAKRGGESPPLFFYPQNLQLKLMTQGIVVGADDNITWLLPWWWKYYSLHNTYPVTFVDFGLSAEAKAWCEERGNLVALKTDSFVTPQEKIDPNLALEWENFYGKKVWQAREGWFKKPFAMLLSPYDKTIWMDLDCEVMGNVSPLFDFLTEEADISLNFDPGRPGIYNSGVVVFRKGAPLIADWAQACTVQNCHSIGDDYVVSRLIATEKYRFKTLPQEYNWWVGQGLNFSALILHWAAWGKTFIETHGGLQASITAAKNSP